MDIEAVEETAATVVTSTGMKISCTRDELAARLA